MPDPLALRDMDRALARLRQAIQANEKIQIHGDYDVDGTTSTVILKRAIELAGGQATYRIPNRLREGYGLHRGTVEEAAADGVTLIISVDTGIRAAQVVEHARAFGIDVIVTDHHLPEAELPRAVAVVNPNRADCTYAGKNLCGAGVTFKLVQALLGTLEWPPDKLHRVLASFLKLVAIGTVADVVPLTGENRIIVRFGLRGLATRKNPGLDALFQVAGLSSGSPTANQIAFRIAPRINAAGRMANAAEVVELFLTSDAERARAIAQQLHEWNAERQGEEARVVEEIIAACTLEPLGDADGGLVFCAPNWHRGVLGIVASRLVERYCRPVFVLSNEDGVARGSGRSVTGFMLLDALDSMDELFVQHGGHSHAAGLTMQAIHVDEFRARFSRYAAERLPPDERRPQLKIGALVEIPDVTRALLADLENMEPFGCGNPEPVLALLACEVLSVQWMKEKHIKLAVRKQGHTLRLKAFHWVERAAEVTPGSLIDVAFTLSADSYSGGWAAIVKDVRPALL